VTEYLTEVAEVPQRPPRPPNDYILAYKAFKTSNMKAARVNIPDKKPHYIFMMMRNLASNDENIKATFINDEVYLEKLEIDGY